jgi:hypothetical protein
MQKRFKRKTAMAIFAESAGQVVQSLIFALKSMAEDLRELELDKAATQDEIPEKVPVRGHSRKTKHGITDVRPTVRKRPSKKYGKTRK